MEFLAVLELVKQRRVSAIQEKLFGDIVIEPVGNWINDDLVQIYSEMEREDEPEAASEGEPDLS